MPIDLNEIRSQLRPGFTPVNSALLVVLFFLAWPLAFAMLAYILAGQRIGLNLGKPETYSDALSRLKIALKGAVSGFQNASQSSSGPTSTGTPDNSTEELQREWDKLSTAQTALERERQNFEEEKKAFREKKPA